MLVVCAASVLIGAVVGSATGSPKHLQVNLCSHVKNITRKRFLIECHSILDLPEMEESASHPTSPSVFLEGECCKWLPARVSDVLFVFI